MVEPSWESRKRYHKLCKHWCGKILLYWGVAIAQWIPLRLPFGRPRLESHLCLYQFICELYHLKKANIKHKEAKPFLSTRQSKWLPIMEITDVNNLPNRWQYLPESLGERPQAVYALGSVGRYWCLSLRLWCCKSKTFQSLTHYFKNFFSFAGFVSAPQMDSYFRFHLIISSSFFFVSFLKLNFFSSKKERNWQENICQAHRRGNVHTGGVFTFLSVSQCDYYFGRHNCLPTLGQCDHVLRIKSRPNFQILAKKSWENVSQFSKHWPKSIHTCFN